MARRKEKEKINRKKDWICPYFRWDGATFVSCDAGRPSFPNRTYANEYMNYHCASISGWHECSLAKYWNDYNENVEEEYEEI